MMLRLCSLFGLNTTNFRAVHVISAGGGDAWRD